MSITHVLIAARVYTVVAQKLKFFHGILSVIICKFILLKPQKLSSCLICCSSVSPQHKLLALCIKIATKKSGSEFHKM